jgi:hypothetical protein
VSFDVGARVQQWSSGSPNHGWRIRQTTAGYNPKTFFSSEYAADASLRPKLTIVYGGASNAPPSVALTSPVNGASIALGASFALAATASDSDGSVAGVAFFANGAPIGSDASAPYGLTWTPAATGSYTLTAVATDDDGATTTSAPVTVTVTPPVPVTVVLQRGLAGYAGAADTFLDNFLRTTPRGGLDLLYVSASNYVSLVRFAIFQADGGPVPDNATILSARLELYKGLYNDTLALNALLKPWVESQATWNSARTGIAWAVGGAGGDGSDYVATNDALVSAPYSSGWVSFDVTGRIRQWAGSANYGWRMSQTTSGYNPKTFIASEYATDPSLRPKLTIVYQ